MRRGIDPAMWRWGCGVVLIAAAVTLAAPAEERTRRQLRKEMAAPSTASSPASTQPASSPTTTQAASQPAAPKLVPISFNNAPLPEIAKFLTEQMGRPVIIAKEVAGVQVTLTNPKPLPPADAMDVLITALHEAGVAIEERERTVHLIPIAQVAQINLRTLGPEAKLEDVTPANDIVRKIFSVRYYDPQKLVDIVKPLLPSWSQVTADAASGKLMIVSTVERLRGVDGIIRQLDAPDVTGGELRVFQIKHADVTEILPMLQRLVAGYLGIDVKSMTPGDSGGGRYSDYDRYRGGDRAPTAAPPSGAVMLKTDKTPVLLIPEPRRGTLVVVAPTNVLMQIEGWLKYLDQPTPPRTQSEIVEVKYGDAGELVGQLTTMLNAMPDESLRNSVRLFPFGSSRRIMIVGSDQSRTLVKNWLAEIDVPDSGVRITQTFTLKNADAQQVADNVKELFGESSQRSRYFFYYDDYYGGRRGGGEDRTKVTVTANTRSNSLTVVASPEKMKSIEERIHEWDKPLAGDEALPRIYDLRYADPEKTKELLENLFSKKEAVGQRIYWWDEEQPTTQSPVGRLFGQFRFEAYPDTGKLVVVSKNEENYGIIDRMIREIDSPQTGGLPRIIQLKFADAETLAEQLNALLNAPGTPASILRRGQTGTFKELSNRGSPYSQQNQNNNNQGRDQQQNQQRGGAGSGEMQFWWQNPPSDLVKNRQPSNLVGKMRIVPNVEQNLLLVVAPQEFADAIEQFVHDLDRPGQQVLIKALIAEITHEDQTSLGYRFSTDPDAFGAGADSMLTDNGLRGLLTYDFEDFFGRQNRVTFSLDVNNLLSLLRRVTDLKIRSEPKVFTADNVEAEFFDGQDIPFITDSQVNGIAGQTQSFDYKEVGIRLRVRPHITKERNIDLTVNLLVSNVASERIFNFAVVNRRETTTRIVLEDGHTFMISGILREEDRTIKQGIPGLQDIPLVGEVFKHHQVVKVNREVVIFLTPYVIGPSEPHSVIESDPLNRLKEKMDIDEHFGPSGEQDSPTTQPANSQPSEHLSKR